MAEPGINEGGARESEGTCADEMRRGSDGVAVNDVHSDQSERVKQSIAIAMGKPFAVAVALPSSSSTSNAFNLLSKTSDIQAAGRAESEKLVFRTEEVRSTGVTFPVVETSPSHSRRRATTRTAVNFASKRQSHSFFSLSLVKRASDEAERE